MYLYRTQLLMNQNSKLMLRYRNYEISNPWFPPQTGIYVILSINTNTINGEMNLQPSSGTSGVL